MRTLKLDGIAASGTGYSIPDLCIFVNNQFTIFGTIDNKNIILREKNDNFAQKIVLSCGDTEKIDVILYEKHLSAYAARQFDTAAAQSHSDRP
ncbi:MAG TPA: hypothetical protein DDX71_05060 [Ruminococcus sp.]|nr:hypothetical protein [Ruminococcus sp.]